MRAAIVFACLAMLGAPAVAELQQVEVGGELRIRGRYYINTFNAQVPGQGIRAQRWPAPAVPLRALGPFGLTSVFDFDSRGPNFSFVEQRSVINVRARFSQDVSAFIEASAIHRWGEGFRREYVANTRQLDTVNARIFQAYIEADQLMGQPLRARIGRQELTFGKGWLYASRSTPVLGISYDAVRLTYYPGDWTIDAWWSKLAENSPVEEDGDVDYYGVYATYAGLQSAALSAHYSLIRDARAVNDTQAGLFQEWMEDLLGLDQYGPTYLHTLGLRLAGGGAGWDYDIEAAYQFGDAHAVGGRYRFGVYGDDRARWKHWAADAELGYTFDAAWRPRIALGGAYFDGNDRRAISFWEWANPFRVKPRASTAFNRLFSASSYSDILDLIGVGKSMSNFWQARASVAVQPTDQLTADFTAAYLRSVDPFDYPAHLRWGRLRIPIAPDLSFWTQRSARDIGVTTHLRVTYRYSEDWWFAAGWERLFTGQALADGVFLPNNAHSLAAGTNRKNADYFYFDTQVRF